MNFKEASEKAMKESFSTAEYEKKIWNAAVRRCAEVLCAECREYNSGKAEHWDGEKCDEFVAIMEVEI